ncbi:hypothetical protein LTR37_021192 [Vermiconidia calcicola]|uniref:Uncharacterized protein n=1 Tax=Vermiconidia calcicola TaxID=1690605 RepID=A0ACC3MC69_9PEZI|nr:hypothetical protein LTR37_021192 [Vermiconidia calcicola]
MWATTLLLAFLSVFGAWSSAFALSLPASTETEEKQFASQKTPHIHARINLTEVEPGSWTLDTRSLVPRRQLDYCISSSQNFFNCLTLFDGLATVAIGISQTVKAFSDGHNCDKSNVHTVDDIVYKYRSVGGDCHTTATFDTILGGVAEYLRAMNKQVCGIECIQLDHGGDWTGYLTVAPKSYADQIDEYYCGPLHDFSTNQCGSGGKKDAPPHG